MPARELRITQGHVKLEPFHSFPHTHGLHLSVHESAPDADQRPFVVWRFFDDHGGAKHPHMSLGGTAISLGRLAVLVRRDFRRAVYGFSSTRPAIGESQSG